MLYNTLYIKLLMGKRQKSYTLKTGHVCNAFCSILRFYFTKNMNRLYSITKVKGHYYSKFSLIQFNFFKFNFAKSVTDRTNV